MIDKFNINGAGPVGLILGILLYLTDNRRIINIYEKRLSYHRDQNLSIDKNTIDNILECLNDKPKDFIEIIQKWSGESVLISEIEEDLTKYINNNTNVKIHRGMSVPDLKDKHDVCLIGADGAHSDVRKKYFGNLLMDEHITGYLVQVKFKTNRQTKNRKKISAIAYSMINSVTGSDIALDFETLGCKNQNTYKNGTLHIPVNKNIYDKLNRDNKGSFKNPWKCNELKNIKNQNIEKLLNIIDRYRFSLSCRGGNMIDEKITTLPLKVYRSVTVAKMFNKNYIFLVGDASSGLVYQRGLNKGWIESTYLIQCLNYLKPDTEKYNNLYKTLYHNELEQIFKKASKISNVNKSLTIISLIILIILFIIIGYFISNQILHNNLDILV